MYKRQIKMSVREDYEEIRKVIGCGEDEMGRKISETAELLGISHLLDRHPYDLSGGEQQKAAIGKILLLRPRLLLLDEPTKGIDAWSKQQLQLLLKSLKEQGISILMVTHDVEFAAGVSDRCGLFFDHAVVSLDTPEEFFCNNNYYTTAANRISRPVSYTHQMCIRDRDLSDHQWKRAGLVCQCSEYSGGRKRALRRSLQ